MNKITKFLLIVVCVLLFIYFLVNGYAKKSEDMSELVGSKIGGGELSTSDYYSLVQCVETYIDYLKQKDFEMAYQMLNNNYKEYVSYEKYQEKVAQKDYSQTNITDVEIITATTYRVTTTTEGQEEQFSIIIDGDSRRFLLLPESFLDYQKVNTKVFHHQLKCVLKEYVVYTDKSEMMFEVTNNSNKDAHLTMGKCWTTFSDEIEKNVDITIKAKETIPITVSFETDYTFPKKVILYKNNNGKADIEYLFEIED